MDRIRALFEEIMSKGRTRLSNRERRKAEEKMGDPVLRPVIEHIKTFLLLLKDVWSSEYEVPHKVVIVIVAALIYLVWTYDVIPDFIPVIGFLDDMLVITAAAKLCARDLEKYRRWKQNRGEK